MLPWPLQAAHLTANSGSEVMKYRDDMTQEEADKLLAEIQRLDALYDNVPYNQPATQEMWDAYEQSLEYFNRYIAGDRK